MKKEVTFSDILYFSKLDNKEKLNKFASASQVTPEVLQRAEQANENKSYKRNVVAVVLAVTSWEYYGPNDNGDSFHEIPIGGQLDANETLVARYKTFESGNVFKYHQSDDPDKAVGIIHFAYYNEEQHRIELVVEVEWDKDADTCLKLKRGVPLNVSMGCGVEYDICSVCGKKAKTPGEHCSHVKYNLMGVENGIPVFMINVKPTWFDLSFVVIPGDMNAKVLHVVEE